MKHTRARRMVLHDFARFQSGVSPDAQFRTIANPMHEMHDCTMGIARPGRAWPDARYARTHDGNWRRRQVKWARCTKCTNARWESRGQLARGPMHDMHERTMGIGGAGRSSGRDARNARVHDGNYHAEGPFTVYALARGRRAICTTPPGRRFQVTVQSGAFPASARYARRTISPSRYLPTHDLHDARCRAVRSSIQQRMPLASNAAAKASAIGLSFDE
jgi:hypothetical protein